ncbi:GH11977 [Drosophila grimshawi]|uniref:GH11977 n=1 Tax=Drosophila grimshawi TaxID=7222 RepID=B4K0Y6_DROGR|nr:GH11977 [Drosophila grimshawi]
MRFVPALAFPVLCAVVFVSWANVVKADALAEAALSENAELKKQLMTRKTTTLSPKALFLMHANPGKTKITTTTSTTTAKPKTKAKSRPKTKPARKSRAQCSRCPTNSTVITHMEKSENGISTDPSVNANPLGDASLVALHHSDDMKMDADVPLPSIAPGKSSDAATILLANGTLQEVRTKADLIALDTVNVTKEDLNIFP